ncbi:DNA_pol_B_2 domain-containing protein [Trichonephila clavipes]|nr:DNA_pol_B_2 domain-containing protein [Trichonephila clavipes]
MEEERSITGTWVTEEVKKAREKGYKIVKIYEVYHFQSSSNDLFRSYIDLFLKIKQEASDKNSINVNLGRRSVAKLALNSFWGRWGMNLNKNKLTFVSTVHDFNKMLMDKTKDIKDVFLPTPEIAAFQWTQSNDFVTQDSSTNIFIAAFTTCHARLKLYSEIEKLNASVLYFDTDSQLFTKVME